MNKTKIIAIAGLFTIVAILLPIISILNYSKQQAVGLTQDRLSRVAVRALQRTHKTIDDAKQTLYAFNNYQVEPCSDAHVRKLQLETAVNRSIDNIAYVEDGRVKCSALGKLTQPVLNPTPDIVTIDNVEVSFGKKSAGSNRLTMTNLYYQSYVVQINSGRFSDVIADSGLQIAVYTHNQIPVSMLNHPDEGLLAALIGKSAIPQAAKNIIYVVEQDDDFIVIATTADRNIDAIIEHEKLMLLPFGVILSALVSYLIYLASKRQLSFLSELKYAIKKRELFVHYQPLIELDTGRCLGAEALVRWKKADGKMVPPDRFIPIAEENHLITRITDLVIESVMRDLSQFLLDNPDAHIAINLSAQDITSDRLIEVIKSITKNSTIKESQIWLETTERGFMDFKVATNNIHEIRKLGHWIAIDDFGTGYSSLSYLQELPLDVLKIDKSFINTIGTDSVTNSVTPHIISIAKTLGLKIVAEGIETQKQVDYLKTNDVEYGQGWLYSKALPVEEFILFCKKNHDQLSSPSA